MMTFAEIKRNNDIFYVDPRCMDMPVQKGRVQRVYRNNDGSIESVEVWNDHLGEVEIEAFQIFATKAEAVIFCHQIGIKTNETDPK